MQQEEVKFYDLLQTNYCEGIAQQRFRLIKNESVGIEDDQIPS